VYIGLTDIGLSGIHILDMNGGATVVIPADYSDDPHASWSPDGTQLVFQVYDGVYRVNADGTGLTKIAQPIDWVAWTAWRPGMG
jgi:Tol biopolymer transport system component